MIATIAIYYHNCRVTPELRWLRSFLAVAEQQHFSRAARRLNLAQPALTAHIQHLEAALGSTLFERTNRMNGLTPAGRALLPEAETIVNRSDALARKVREVAHGETGLLRLGLIPPAATSAAADSLRRLNRELTGVEVQVQQGYQDRLEHLLLDGDLDLVLGRPPENKALAHRRQFVEQQGVLMRVDDELAKNEIVPLRELGGLRLVLLRGNPHFGQNFLELAEKHGVKITALHVAEDFPSLHWMVRAGFGVAPCSLLLADALPGGLVAKPVRPLLPKLEIHAIWRGIVPPPPAARWLKMLGDPFA
jgi:DNA-binding transcriptional LysR family regulator